MALIEELDSNGNWLFKWRSYLPVIMYLLAFLVLVFDTENNFIAPEDTTLGLICLAVSFVGIFIRALVIGFVPKATSGRNTEKQVAETVNTQGIYSLVRHPLYLGNFFMWLGIILYVGNIWFTIVSCLLYWVYYERIMFAEEFFMRNKFGNKYTDWAKNVPPFFPKLSGFKSANLDFSFKNVLKREYSGFLAVFVSFFFLNFIKNYFQEGDTTVQPIWAYLLGIAALITISLKLMKKQGLLEVSGR
jgi:protein-S-isoprenylcysteine O-methyltransferase Ste14